MSKVMTMTEAISKFVKSGDLLFISGAQHGEPSAAIHEIVRQKIDHLTVVACLVNTQQLLIGEGLVDKVLTGYMPQDESRSTGLAKSRRIGKRPEIKEYSHFGIAMALLAGQMGIPFMPLRCMIGSDMLKYNDNITSMERPFDGGQIGAVKAITPDIGILHVQRCDAEGTAQKWGTVGVDQEGINASRKIIITTEKIVDADVIRRDPNRTMIPGFRVSAVVEQPWGAHPMHMASCYNGDMFGYMMDLRGEEKYEAYLKDLVYGTANWDEYLKKRAEVKGEEYFKNLEIKNPVLSDPIISGF